MSRKNHHDKIMKEGNKSNDIHIYIHVIEEKQLPLNPPLQTSKADTYQCEKCHLWLLKGTIHFCPNQIQMSNGYMCNFCGQWIPYGSLHNCHPSTTTGIPRKWYGVYFG